MLRVVALAAVLLLPTVANAASIFATGIDAVSVGTGQGSANDRDNQNNILGATDGKFYELGKGGSIDLIFGGTIGSPTTFPFLVSAVSVLEITFGSNPEKNWPESFDVYGLLGPGPAEFIASLSNFGGTVATLVPAKIFDTIRIKDTTGASTPGGGADIDSVAIRALNPGGFDPNPVPLPAAAWLFLSVMGGAGALRRFGRKA